MENTNEMTIIFDSYSSNEAFARVAVAAFMTSLNPTVEEVADVKDCGIRGCNQCDHPRIRKPDREDHASL